MKNLNTYGSKKIRCLFAALLTIGVEAFAQQSLRLSQADCRQMALSYSEDMQKADNSVDRAELNTKIARSAALPDISGSAGLAYMFPDVDMMGFELRMRGTYMAGISLTQPIYAGGKIASSKRMAKIGAESAEEQRRMTRMDVIEEADNAYWTLIAVNQKVKMMEAYCAQMDTLRSQVADAVDVGMATTGDLLRVEAERSNIMYQMQKVRNGADLCRMSLCRIIGAEFDTEIEPTDTAIVVELPQSLSTDIESRPEKILLEKQVLAQEQQIKLTRGDMLPTVGLTAGYSYYGNIKLLGTADNGDGTTSSYSQTFQDGTGMAMLAVQIPIFHWGESRNKVRQAKFDLRNAELDLQKNTRLLSLEAQQAIRNMSDGYMMVTMATTAMDQAEESLRVTSNRYSESMTPLSDLLDAQSQWEQARSNLIEARTQYKIYETEYLRATGTLE